MVAAPPSASPMAEAGAAAAASAATARPAAAKDFWIMGRSLSEMLSVSVRSNA